MILDFDSMPTATLKNFKGGENELYAAMFADPLTRIMKGTVPPGSSIGLHTHTDSCEVIYCLSGSAKAVYDGTEERLSAGQAHYCPKGHSHTIINDTAEPMLFLAVVPQQ